MEIPAAAVVSTPSVKARRRRRRLGCLVFATTSCIR
jgi:hypothetical protein